MLLHQCICIELMPTPHITSFYQDDLGRIVPHTFNALLRKQFADYVVVKLWLMLCQQQVLSPDVLGLKYLKH